MLRHGIYTMHDFHVFRLYEFGKCVSAGQFPCRWAPDAGMGYGEPVFNFYGQLPYWIGQIFKFGGWSVIDSIKILFVLSLLLSAVSMYFLARTYWGNWGAVLSAIVYVYAPYRAVDVWVRGALPEALAFVLFPFIFYHFDRLCHRVNKHNFFWLTVSAAALITTHNLSALMLTPFLGLWWIYRWWQNRSVNSLIPLAFAAVLAGWLSAYYLLPVVAESKYITLAQTTRGYYDYRAHFATLHELFISRFWGYGASLWGPVDGLSLSVGQLQWLIPVAILLILIFKYFTGRSNFLVFAGLGLLAIFLTHGRSQFIWQLLPPMAYIQFPWRFLSLATFFLALGSGAAVTLLPDSLRRVTLAGLIVVVVLVNFNFFRPDIWRPISDAQQFSGKLWDEQQASALPDFWPIFGSQMPTAYAFSQPVVLLQTSDYLKIQYPIVYFPGWQAKVDGQPLAVFAQGQLGLITARVPLYYQHLDLQFTNTLPRTLGNGLSLLSLIGISIWYRSKHWHLWS